MILALVMSAAVAAALPSPDPNPADALIAEATDHLLAGEKLPPDIDARLRGLEPSERIRVLVFLRRSGMFDGPNWPIDSLLAPPESVSR